MRIVCVSRASDETCLRCGLTATSGVLTLKGAGAWRVRLRTILELVRFQQPSRKDQLCDLASASGCHPALNKQNVKPNLLVAILASEKDVM